MTGTAHTPTKRSGRTVLALGGVLALALAGIFTLLTAVAPAPAGALVVDQCNDVFNADAQTVECHVTVVNNLTNDPTTTFSVVTVNGVTTNSPELVTAVNQCNGSGNAGGSTVLCTVDIVNNIAINGPSGATGASVNQCVGSGEGASWGVAGPNPCDPFPASASGATITQCNGSGNGGGLVAPSGCTASGTTSASLSVIVNQCNGSANGGDGRIQCSASMSTNVIDTTATGPDSSAGTGGGSDSGAGIAWLPPSSADAIIADARLAG